MSDSINIDFANLRPPGDLVGGFANAFKVGQDLARTSALNNANALYAKDPQAGIKAAMAVDPVYGGQLQGQYQGQQDRQSSIDQATAQGKGDLPGAINAAAGRGATGDVATLKAQLDALPGQQKAQAIADAQQRNEQLAHILLGLKNVPAEQRLGMAQHIAKQSGLLDPSAITADDVTDQGINGHLAMTMTTEQFLKQEDSAARLALDTRKQTFEENKPVYHFGQPGEVATLESGAPGGAAPSGNVPRGLRNNNPLNVTSLPDGQWSGQTGTDGQYATFSTPQAGWAAADKNLATYGSAHGINTIAGVVNRWAPAGKDGNNPVQYAATVAKALGVDPNAQVNLADPATRQKILTAMAGVENGQPVAYGQGAAPGAPAGGAGAGGLPTKPGQSAVIGGQSSMGDTTKTGEAYLGTLDPQQAAQVKALAEGRMAFPAGFALKSPYWQQMLSAVSQYDPNFDAVNFNARAKTRGDFTSGKSAQNITSINTVVNHLGSLYDSIDKMGNGDFTPINAFMHAVSPTFGNTNYKDFDAAKGAVSSEIVRTLRGSSGTEADIKYWQDQLNEANTPAQLKATVKQAMHLIAGRLQPLADQYNSGMGTTKDPLELLRPEGQSVARRILDGASPGPKGAAPAPKGGPGHVLHYNPQTGRVE